MANTPREFQQSQRRFLSRRHDRARASLFLPLMPAWVNFSGGVIRTIPTADNSSADMDRATSVLASAFPSASVSAIQRLECQDVEFDLIRSQIAVRDDSAEPTLALWSMAYSCYC